MSSNPFRDQTSFISKTAVRIVYGRSAVLYRYTRGGLSLPLKLEKSPNDFNQMKKSLQEELFIMYVLVVNQKNYSAHFLGQQIVHSNCSVD